MKHYLTGHRFDFGVVIEEVSKENKESIGRKPLTGRWWKLKCDCGNFYYACTRDLNAGDKKSCGCQYSPDLIGQTFGQGTVIANWGYRKNRKLWLLKCACGNEYKCDTGHLRSGHTKSCGCIAHKPEWGNITSRAWNEIKQGAKHRHKDFKIDRKYAWELFLKQNGKCALSGLDLYFAKDNFSHKKKRDKTASLDRIDNSLGYIEGNVQWTYKDINLMKNKHDESYFLELCKAVVKHAMRNTE